MSVAIVARGDQGGVGAQTWEMARHCAPDRILVLDLGARGRGSTDLSRYGGLGADVRVSRTSRLTAGDVEWLLACSTIYTAEGTYGYDLGREAAVAGLRLVVHANPELWADDTRGATTEVYCPTSWELARVPGAQVMPMPVDRQRIAYRQRAHAATFWHPGAPAMEDRNGTRLVWAALEHVTQPCRVVITGTGQPACEMRHGPVTVELRGERANYFDGYDEADVLLLPRRYGGLCLPAQEALAAGMPVVMLDTGPYTGTPGVLTVPSTGSRLFPMKGGMFDIHDGDPRSLARQVDELAIDDDLVQRASVAAGDAAEQLSWERWSRPWHDLLHR